MKSFDEALWDHLVENHEADRAHLRATTTPSRSGRRPVVAGIAATGLAAAGVATVLATGAGGSAHPSTAGSESPERGVNTAYIVKRVKAEVAGEVSQDDTASRYVEYDSGEVGSDGTLTVGPEFFEGAAYTASDGVEYDHETWYDTDGSTNSILIVVTDPVTDGKQTMSESFIEQANHTYSRTRRTEAGATESSTDPTPSLDSSPSQVQQALQSGQVTQLGTPTFDGRQTVALSIHTPHLRNVLYVDSRTYQPVGQVIYPDHFVTGLSKIGVQYWVPATRANIARAKDDSIPAGDTRVSPDDQTLGNFGSSTTTGSGTATNPGAG